MGSLESIDFTKRKELDLTDLTLSKGNPVLFISDAKEHPMPFLLFRFKGFSNGRVSKRGYRVGAKKYDGEEMNIDASRALFLYGINYYSPKSRILNVREFPREEENIYYIVDRAYAGDEAVTGALRRERGFELYSAIWQEILEGKKRVNLPVRRV